MLYNYLWSRSLLVYDLLRCRLLNNYLWSRSLLIYDLWSIIDINHIWLVIYCRSAKN